jgi:hypothetical protein
VSWRTVVSALLGRSAYQNAPRGGLSLDSPEVEEIRRAQGGQISPIVYTKTRWYLSDLEDAEHLADNGNLAMAARLMRSARKDGIVSGVLSTRTGGLVRLPKKFRGDTEVIRSLELGHDDVRSEFDEMFPPTELALLAADGELLGVGVGELLPVEGRDFPIFVRLDPEFLSYRWSENQWYYRSIAGLLPITPGDGRWILHTPGGRMAPWQNGLWRPIGRAYIRKDHASLYKDNWEAKLANPARVAQAPPGATEEQRAGLLQRVMAWGVNTVFQLPVGYEVKLLESNGRGFDSFNKTIADQNQEIIITIAGQTVTVDGGAGFQNSDVHKTIRADLIKSTAEGLAYTLNTQGLPAYVVYRYGEEAISRFVVVEWDVTPPKDRNSEAQSLVTAANAIKLLNEALAGQGVQLDVRTMCERFSIPLVGGSNATGNEAPTGAGAARISLVPQSQADDEPQIDVDDDEEEAAA